MQNTFKCNNTDLQIEYILFNDNFNINLTSTEKLHFDIVTNKYVIFIEKIYRF